MGKRTYTTSYIKSNCGCYANEIGKLSKVYTSNNKSDCYDNNDCVISIEDIFNSNIPLKDKYWFFCKNLFTKEQNQQISIILAEIVLPIYENKYESKAPREVIEAAKLYLTGHINLDELLVKKRAASTAAAASAYADAYAAYADAYAAYASAAAYAAAAAADAAAAVAYAAAAAVASAVASAADAAAVAYVADAANAAKYTESLSNLLKDFIGIE